MATQKLKAIETEYKGIKFRSKLEAQWAVFFDECGVEWEYEPEGFDLGDGVWYLPDFLLHNVRGRPFVEPSDLYVEVKGNMTDEDKNKIEYFVYGQNKTKDYKIIRKLLVLGPLPKGKKAEDIEDYLFEKFMSDSDTLIFSYMTLDNDTWGCCPGLNQDGNFTIMDYMKPDQYRNNEDWERTAEAYYIARNYRFDHIRNYQSIN